MEAYVVSRRPSCGYLCPTCCGATSGCGPSFAWRYGVCPALEQARPRLRHGARTSPSREQRQPDLIFLLDEAAAATQLSRLTHRSGRCWEPHPRSAGTAESRRSEHVYDAETSPPRPVPRVHLASTMAQAPIFRDLRHRQRRLPRPSADAVQRIYGPPMLGRMKELGRVPLLKIDLRDGSHWWSTRLHALAALATNTSRSNGWCS